jgi:hypothetical protein
LSAFASLFVDLKIIRPTRNLIKTYIFQQRIT